MEQPLKNNIESATLVSSCRLCSSIRQSSFRLTERFLVIQQYQIWPNALKIVESKSGSGGQFLVQAVKSTSCSFNSG
jgi:hypothetical protein